MNPADPPRSRDAQIAALLAAPPPRTVPAELRRAASRQAAPLVTLIFGAAFGLIGLGLGAAYSPWKVLGDWKLSAHDTAQAPGGVTAAIPTGLRINHSRVFRYAFAFTTAAGQPGGGTCYTTGQRWSAGSPVTIRYLPDNPSVCCIVGARLSQGGAAGAVMLIFPGVGLVLVGWVAAARRRAHDLLRRGTVGEALVAAVEQTLTRVNNRYVYRITLQRTDAPEAGRLTLRSHQPAVIAFARDRLASNQPVFVLYDPASTRRVLLPETL